jgi:hypothetical protein
MAKKKTTDYWEEIGNPVKRNPMAAWLGVQDGLRAIEAEQAARGQQAGEERAERCRQALGGLPAQHPVRIAITDVLVNMLTIENAVMINTARAASEIDLRFQAGRVAAVQDVMTAIAEFYPKESAESER